MLGTRNEHTLAASCAVQGRGYWSGKAVRVTCHPAPVGSGIVFARTDLPGAPGCVVTPANAQCGSMRTNLVHGTVRVEMIEHLMAALVALEIDNCHVEVDAEEMPGLDGSAAAYVEALQSAGLVIQAAAKLQLILDQTIRVDGDGDAMIEASPVDGHQAVYSYHLDYGDQSVIVPQSYRLTLTPQNFTRQIAQARTFVTQQQAEQIRSQNVATHVRNEDLLVIGPDGPIDNSFRMRDECARHKVLDLIGDLGLSGVELIGQFRSRRGGHRLNGLMVQQLSELADRQLRRGNPANTLYQQQAHFFLRKIA